MLRDYQQSAVDAAITWLKYKDLPAILVLPTGSGKSHIIKALAEYYAEQSLRVLILAHRKELLLQTGEKIQGDIGYYSAGVGEKRIDKRITIAGVQSISRLDHENEFDVILIDECHLVPNSKKGQYWQIINSNSSAKLVGLTATPWRTESGKLQWGEVVFDIGYKPLLDQNYLTPISNKLPDKVSPNWSKLDVKLGDFITSQIEDAMCEPELVEAAIGAIHQYCFNRNSVLIFCVSINHANIIKQAMQTNGITNVEVLTGETRENERDEMIDRFKRGQLKYLINCEILLVGFDAPNVDTIVCLRPTKSKVLWEQLCGRGVRLHEQKDKCLLVDMAGNLKEHGALGSPYKGKAKKGEPKESMGRLCPSCEEYAPLTAKECPACFYVFPEPEKRAISHEYEPDSGSYSPSQQETLAVSDVAYAEHTSKQSGKTSLRVDYFCDGVNYGKVSEWLSPHNDNEWARGKAHQFFEQRGWDAFGGIEKYSMEDLLFHAEKLKKPSHIIVDFSEKFPRIKGYLWQEVKKEEYVNPFEDDEILY